MFCPEENLAQLPCEGTLVLASCEVGLFWPFEEGSVLSFLIMKQKDDYKRELAATNGDNVQFSSDTYTSSWADLWNLSVVFDRVSHMFCYILFYFITMFWAVHQSQKDRVTSINPARLLGTIYIRLRTPYNCHSNHCVPSYQQAPQNKRFYDQQIHSVLPGVWNYRKLNSMR